MKNDMWASSDDFEKGAKRIVEVFQSIILEEDKDEKLVLGDGRGGLLDWKLEGQQRQGEILFLQHAPIISKWYDELSCNSSPTVVEDHGFDSSNSDDLFSIDDTIICDPDVAKASLLTTNNKDNDETDATTLLLEWSFSVVYSDTWQVPVLYFHVQQQSSREDHGVSFYPCSRSMVVDILSHLHHQNIKKIDGDNDSGENNNVSSSSSWDFVSSDEHPVTGLPCFFLHPCRTRERMEILLKTTTTSEHQQQQQQQESSDQAAMLLLIWMSLILPSVGHGFSAKMFASLMNKLKSCEASSYPR